MRISSQQGNNKHACIRGTPGKEWENHRQGRGLVCRTRPWHDDGDGSYTNYLEAAKFGS